MLVDSLKHNTRYQSAMFNEIFNNTSGPKTEPCGAPHSALHVSKLYVVYIE